MNIFSIWDLKKSILTLLLSGTVLALGYPAWYRIYISKASDLAHGAANNHINRDIFTLCSVHHRPGNYIPNKPDESCINFYNKTVPEQFEFWGSQQKFPFQFTNEDEFVSVYRKIQDDLKAHAMPTLPTLKKLTHGIIDD